MPHGNPQSIARIGFPDIGIGQLPENNESSRNDRHHIATSDKE